jgi:hypothetical protein
MRARLKFIGGTIALSILSLLFLYSAHGGPRNHSTPNQKQDKNKVVYVCACLQTKSCSCMTMAKTGGTCACGPQGGPPLKAVPRDSDWAKENREALAN